MIDVAPYQLKIIHAILQKHVPYCEVRAFGTRVTWTAKDYSDLDLAIVGEKKLADKILYALKEDFEESDLPFRVDVLDWNSISDEFRDVINKGYEVLQKSKTKFKQTEIGMIPEEWEVKELGEIAKFQYGLGESAQQEGDYVYIRITDINPDGFLKRGNLVFIGKDKVNKKDVLTKGDVLVARTGASYGKTYIFREDLKATYGGFLIKILFNKKINNEFYFQYSRSKSYWSQANNLVSGGAQPQFNANVITKLLVPCPSIQEQSAIVKILSDLDSKIELNQQMNKTLEAIGQAIFKRWFIDFEFPNEKGKPYKSSGGEMVFNEELGKDIPKGWKIGKLEEIGKIQPGFAFKSSDFQKNGYKLIKIRNIQSPIIDIVNVKDHLSEEIFNKIDKRFYLNSGDILIAMTGAELGKVGIIQKVNKKMLLNQRVGKAVSDYPLLFYIHLISQNVQGILKRIASASSAQGNVSNSDIEDIDVILPPKETLSFFNENTLSLFDKLIENLAQNNNLSQIRDSLLPRLMSGKIRVPVAIKA